MGKQKRRKTVPAALHSEISEYASLLRVLRTTGMLDVTAQLTQRDSLHASHQAAPVNDEETGYREPPTSSHGDNKDASNEDEVHPSAGRGSGMSSRNNWTRWPLLAGDIHVPEWRFEDEVHSLAKQVLLSDFPISDNLSGDTSSQFSTLHEDQVEALLPPPSLRLLADVSSSHLEGILSALASYSPLVEKSTQNRHHPIGWESVLNIVGAAGLVDGNVIRKVRSRLQAIYGSHLDSGDIVSSVPEPSTVVTLGDLDRANFFDGGSLGNHRRMRGPYKKSGRKPSMTPTH